MVRTYIVRLSEEFEDCSKSRGMLVHICALGLEFDQLKIKYWSTLDTTKYAPSILK